jgi:1-acyl-sn-glycerol-3-phosphate acyltransferase
MLGLYVITFGLFVRIRYNLVRQNGDKLPAKGPFLLIANHCNNFDGLFLQCLCPRLIRYVVTDAVYRNKILGKLLNFVGYIPKRKHTIDIGAIRKIMKTVAQGDIVGIFPEGQRNWDGSTGPLASATYRLIQLLDVPVVVAQIKGAYLTEPRWADAKRRGRVEVTFKTLFKTGDKPDLQQIEAIVKGALAHDEGEWQRNRRLGFKGKALCSGFERLLFVCPACRALGTIDSSANRIWCRTCGAAFHLDEYGFFHDSDGSAHTIHALNAWQQSELEKQLSCDDVYPVIDEDATLYMSSEDSTPFESIAYGALRLTQKQLSIGDHAFDIGGISSVSVYFKSHLDFRYGCCDYRIGFSDKRVSAYKWQCAIMFLKQAKKQQQNINRGA